MNIEVSPKLEGPSTATDQSPLLVLKAQIHHLQLEKSAIDDDRVAMAAIILGLRFDLRVKAQEIEAHLSTISRLEALLRQQKETPHD